MAIHTSARQNAAVATVMPSGTPIIKKFDTCKRVRIFIAQPSHRVHD